MRECYEKSIRWTIIMFVSIMIYCVASIINKFSYLDLAYLFVVIGYFAVYLKRIKEI